MEKAIKITLKDSDGNNYRWTVNRVPRAINCNFPTTLESRVISGWEFTDHEGYTRFNEGNWMSLVARVHSVAYGYGLTANIS